MRCVDPVMQFILPSLNFWLFIRAAMRDCPYISFGPHLNRILYMILRNLALTIPQSVA